MGGEEERDWWVRWKGARALLRALTDHTRDKCPIGTHKLRGERVLFAGVCGRLHASYMNKSPFSAGYALLIIPLPACLPW
jgi:hypothetical protein